jgi:hypothetical protein
MPYRIVTDGQWFHIQQSMTFGLWRWKWTWWSTLGHIHGGFDGGLARFTPAIFSSPEKAEQAKARLEQQNRRATGNRWAVFGTGPR